MQPAENIVPFVRETPPVPTATPPAPMPQDRSYARRWKHEALFAKGHVGVPVTFLQLYAQLKPYPLTMGEAVFVLHLMQFKWDEKEPFPSYKVIAAQMGVSDKMARRHAKSLEDKHYLRREKRQGLSNRFDLNPLFDALAQAAAERAGKTTANG